MTYTQHNNMYILRLMPGEELLATIKQFCVAKHITGAWLQGLGAVRSAHLASFNVKSKQYNLRTFDNGWYEVSNFTGNVAGDRVHIHITIGDHDFATFAGHCNSAVADPTLEVLIIPFATLQREFDEYCELHLLQLDQRMDLMPTI